MAEKDTSQISKKTRADMAASGMDKAKALQTALANIEKQFGKGAIMRLGENARMSVSSIPTGSIGLNIALGIGGVPRGRIVEIYGPEASGKTTLALHIVAEAQKMGGEAAFIDAEHALDPVYAKVLGVDTEQLLISQPDTGEQALEITEQLVRSNAVDIIVVDSVAALVPKSEIDGSMGESHVGVHARLMSQALRKLAGAISRGGCVVVFINQVREKIGISYGNPEVTTGGRALKFYASVRIEVRKGEYIKDGSDNIGSYARAKVVKNKVAPPFKVAEFEIMYGKGIIRESELAELGEKLGFIQKSGAWFTYGDVRVQGRPALRDYFIANPEAAKDLEAKIVENADKLENPKTKKEKGKAAKGGKKADSDFDSDDAIPEGGSEAGIDIEADDYE